MRTIRINDEVHKFIKEYQRLSQKQLTTSDLIEKFLQKLKNKDKLVEIVEEKLEMIKNENRKKDT